MNVNAVLDERLNENRNKETRTRIALTRAAAHEDYLEHDADFSADFNHRLYAPRMAESPADLRDYHGTSIGAIFCACVGCQFIRQNYSASMNGWVVLPLVRLVRRVARAPVLKTVPEPICEIPDFIGLDEEFGIFKRGPGGVVLVGPI